MLYDKEITLPRRLENLTFAGVQYAGKAVGGALALQLPEDPETQGSLYIPQEFAQKERVDVGRCLESGDLYVFRPYTGIWVVNPGWAKGAGEVHIHVGGCDGVIAKIEEKRLRMLRDEVLIQRQPKREEFGGLVLPDESKRWSGIAKVLEVGPDVQEVQVGDTILSFEGSGLMGVRLGDEIGEWYGCDPACLGVIKESNIGVIESQ